MISKLVILKNREDFDKFQKSRAYYSRFLRLRVVSSNQNIPRFGFIIPKKTVAKVTDRNKIKRRLKSILRESLQNIQIKDFLIFPSKQVLTLTYSELSHEVVNLLKQAKLWRF